MDAIASPPRRTAPVVPLRDDTLLGLLEFLHKDPRPAFVVDATPTSLHVANGHVLDYWNSAMADVDAGSLLQQLARQSSIPENDGSI